MTEVVGGLRTRLIYDSVFNQINDGLTVLGWFDSGRSHRDITFLSEPLAADEEVQLNTVSLGEGPMFDREAETGSDMAEAEYAYFVDIYAESGPVGRALANDIRDLVKGRHGGRTGPTFTIWDYRTATPSQIGYVDVERVNVFREDVPTKPWQKFWYTVRFDIVDYYYGSD